MGRWIRSEARLLVAVLLLAVLLNVPYGRYALYPFVILSTWIHETWHGIAALLAGGSIRDLSIYPDGSGLARTMRPATAWATALVASAGYMGTAVTGGLLLVFRRLRGAGRYGLGLLGIAMLATVLLLVRNAFGMAMVALVGVLLLGTAMVARPSTSGFVFAFVAATCCLNAVTSIGDLFSANLVVNGQPAGGSDATTVAQTLGLPYWFWAALWLVWSLGWTALGIRFPLRARSGSRSGTPPARQSRRST